MLTYYGYLCVEGLESCSSLFVDARLFRFASRKNSDRIGSDPAFGVVHASRADPRWLGELRWRWRCDLWLVCSSVRQVNTCRHVQPCLC